MTITFANPANIPWSLMAVHGADGVKGLFYGRTGTGRDQRPWHGEGTWQNGKPVIANQPAGLTLTHWLSKPNYEVTA